MTEAGIILTYSMAWLPMVIIAIVNGVIREKIYGRSMPELRSHQLSSVTAIAAFLAYTYVLFSFIPLESTGQALVAGTVWLMLTITFEFIFGRYVAGYSWHKLLSDYNLFKGRVWVIVLISVFLAPLLIFIMKNYYT